MNYINMLGGPTGGSNRPILPTKYPLNSPLLPTYLACLLQRAPEVIIFPPTLPMAASLPGDPAALDAQ